MQAIVRRQNIFSFLISRIYSRSYSNICYGIITKKCIKQMTQHTIYQVIQEIENTNNFNELWLYGFKNLKSCICDYFHDVEEWSSHDIESEVIEIKVFGSAYLENEHKIIIRASPNYYEQAAFSDVCVKMDESEQDDYLTDNGFCYAKYYMIEHYTLIPIASIANIVHIIPKFSKPENFYVNKYIEYY
ncbi:unnamed protein product [Rhizophagus irregularis]|nr:unnamed protein product [Rhizophagus irregularis]